METRMYATESYEAPDVDDDSIPESVSVGPSQSLFILVLSIDHFNTTQRHLICVYRSTNLRATAFYCGYSAGAPTQIRKWGDKFGERSEPKNFFAPGGIIPPRNSKTNIALV